MTEQEFNDLWLGLDVLGGPYNGIYPDDITKLTTKVWHEFPNGVSMNRSEYMLELVKFYRKHEGFNEQRYFDWVGKNYLPEGQLPTLEYFGMYDRQYDDAVEYVYVQVLGLPKDAVLFDYTKQAYKVC